MRKVPLSVLLDMGPSGAVDHDAFGRKEEV